MVSIVFWLWKVKKEELCVGVCKINVHVWSDYSIKIVMKMVGLG